MSLNFNHLFYFYMVVREKGMNSASRTLGVSQPTLSSQIKIFETTLGESLFNRNGKSLELTEKGQMLYSYARQMFEISNDMMNHFQEMTPSTVGRVEIGVSDEIEKSFVLRLMGKIYGKKELSRQPRVKLTSGPHSRLITRLRERSIDVLITAQGTAERDLSVLQEFKSPVMLVGAKELLARSKAKPAGAKKIKPSQLVADLNVGLVAPSEPLLLRTETDQFIEKERVLMPVVYESDLISAVLRGVIDQVGVAFLPQLYISHLEKGALETIGRPDGYWRHSVFLLTHNRNVESALVKGVRDAFRDRA